MQPMGTFIRFDENFLSVLNGLFVRVLLKMDLRLPLKKVMVINDEDGTPVLLSYEKLFKVYFYGGQMRSEDHTCLAVEDKDGWLLVDKFFDDESLVYPAGAKIYEETGQELHWGRRVMLVFPQPVLEEDVNLKYEDDVKVRDQNRTRKENRPDCDMSSGATVGGGAENVADVDKGKNSMEEDEEFMKAKEENNEQIQYLGSRKRGRNNGTGNVSASYNNGVDSGSFQCLNASGCFTLFDIVSPMLIDSFSVTKGVDSGNFQCPVEVVCECFTCVFTTKAQEHVVNLIFY
ncbi:hypothetical protein D8674_013091 [Pyrus ussuriensis x Pyrus communis]|uniref:Uncharacterized protein n=1 Tax=Pyrus ussuriensis x Pyrus communis TaxID=2448454 RepID=A0A5N5GU67_9ROSA|nr:hypothetical protein D8674_013091 [Pyrus ussuriensis x Pyrus communis]